MDSIQIKQIENLKELIKTNFNSLIDSLNTIDTNGHISNGIVKSSNGWFQILLENNPGIGTIFITMLLLPLGIL